jgi:hypothetical protein
VYVETAEFCRGYNQMKNTNRISTFRPNEVHFVFFIYKTLLLNTSPVCKRKEKDNSVRFHMSRLNENEIKNDLQVQTIYLCGSLEAKTVNWGKE